MTKNSFTAGELYCMARLAGKHRMYGIPDVLSGVSKEERPVALSAFYDELVQNGIAAVDFAGNTTLLEEYRQLPDIYCDCEQCLTITRQEPSGKSTAYIFWKRENNIHMAEPIGEQYLISQVTADDVRNYCSVKLDAQSDTEDGIDVGTPIPQNALIKAKRAAMSGEHEKAVRILRENGASQQLAGILSTGLEVKAEYVGLLLMTDVGETVETKEISWLQQNGIALTAHKEVINYRSCIAFEQVSGVEMQEKADEIIAAFLAC